MLLTLKIFLASPFQLVFYTMFYKLNKKAPQKFKWCIIQIAQYQNQKSGNNISQKNINLFLFEIPFPKN